MMDNMCMWLCIWIGLFPFGSYFFSFHVSIVLKEVSGMYCSSADLSVPRNVRDTMH